MSERAPITRRQWLAMGTLSLGVSLVIMDATIVNVALPVVIEDLGLDSAGAQWMNAIYSLVFASLMLTVGRSASSASTARLGRLEPLGVAATIPDAKAQTQRHSCES